MKVQKWDSAAGDQVVIWVEADGSFTLEVAERGEVGSRSARGLTGSQASEMAGLLLSAAYRFDAAAGTEL